MTGLISRTLLRLAIKSFKVGTVKYSFATTGLCPMSRDAIPNDLMVGDDPVDRIPICSTRDIGNTSGSTPEPPSCSVDYEVMAQPTFEMYVSTPDEEIVSARAN